MEESYNKDERAVADTAVFDGDPSSDSEEEAFNPYAGAAAGGAFVSPMVPVPQTNDNATISLAMGIATWLFIISSPFLCFTGCLAPITTVIGVVFGHLGLRDSRNLNGLKRGEALIGLILNYLALTVIALTILGSGALLAGIGYELS